MLDRKREFASSDHLEIETMALNIDAVWAQPVALTLSRSNVAIYDCGGIESVPEDSGVYVFARAHGDLFSPIYIGRSTNLRSRLEQHLDTVSLMRQIQARPAGRRIFLYCEPFLHPGQQLARVLNTLETALISHALSEGHELLNVQGARRSSHKISFTGNRTSEAFAPRTMRVRAW